jgi:hypothetical protein
MDTLPDQPKHQELRPTAEPKLSLDCHNSNDLAPAILQIGQHRHDLISLSTVAQYNYNIALLNHPRPPWQRVGWMKMESGRSDACHRSRDLLGDDPRFTNAEDNDLSLATRSVTQSHRSTSAGFKPISRLSNSIRFNLQQFLTSAK